MKRVIQLILFFSLIVITFIFYNKYFNDQNKVEIIKKNSLDQTKKNEENNIIKNLKYEISIDKNNNYNIFADLSEITYKDGSELVLMKKVTASLTDENNVSLLITSDKASYNNSNYNTNFEKNIEIKYLDNIIFAENLILNFENNLISIFEDVKYSGPRGNLKTDNIKIDLITKNIDIFMNNNESVVITSNK